MKLLSLSDIHLGCPLIPTSAIIYGIDKLLADTKDLSTVDVLLLNGDIFDLPLYLCSKVVPEIQEWIIRVLCLCKKHNIILLILEGTPKHDRKQSNQFIVLNDTTGIKADVRYYQTLCLDDVVVKGKTYKFLFLPDEYHTSAAETEIEIKQLLKTNNISQVDFISMHGAFKYQFPVVSQDCHDMDFFNSIVRYYIFVGHIHKMSRYEKILAQGSTHRIGHGYEEPKGFFKVEVDDGLDLVTFVENPYASIFKTCDISKLNPEEAYLRVSKLIKKLENINLAKDVIHLSLIVDKVKHIDVVKTLKNLNQTIKWKVEGVKKKTGRETTQVIEVYKPIPINPDTIVGIMSDRFKQQGISNETHEKALQLLQQIKNL
jgi:DNA repair exonuclease SbcCD nuclease subunit